MTSLKYPLGLAVGLAAGVWATSANAVPVPIFSTGVDDNSVPLSAGTLDTHYTQNGTGAFVVNNAFPLPAGGGPWQANTGNSQWIAPQADQTVGSPPGTYTYRAVFDLSGIDPDSVVISGQWAADNGAAILLNGQPTNATIDDSSFTFTPFTIDSGYVPGLNAFTFVVNNVTDVTSPTGLQVQLSGTGTPSLGPAPIPEPTSLALLGLGIAGLGLLRHRRYSV